MPRLDDAQRRIDQALDRLEATTRARKESTAQLARLRADHEALKQTTETVSARLDAAISRLKTVLEA